jgi:hypothetical protein
MISAREQRPCTRNGTGNAQGSGWRRRSQRSASLLQQLDQLLPPGLRLPEHGQGFRQGHPARAGSEQLGGEHPPLAPLPLGEPLGIGG